MKFTRGPITTTRSWTRPNKAAICAWYEDMKFVIERTGLTAYLVGRSLTDIENTFDVDIVYVGEFKPDVIEQLLITTLTTGFRHKLLVDARWQNTVETAEYKDNEIIILSTGFTFLNYYEQDYENGHKVINDFRLNPQYKVVNDNLVYSTFDRVTHRLKTHQMAYLIKHGKFASVLLEDYCKE